ncbi:RHS repeat-associated core domain-containing protein, partial [Salmonella enterica subsp. salamae]|nr:RHS repeat-associated core domain-containing protein [Salmonella enterica subsp. salamae]
NPHNMKQHIRLPGQQYDEETGLYYNRHRYYDPLQGRYITQDPIGLRGGWNFYVYTSNPIIEIDPLGLAGWDSLGSYINQPGYKSKVTNVAPEGADTTKPVSLRPDGYPWGYGCGDESTDKFVPDGLYGVSFMQACRNHDICYGTSGSSKQSCDTHLGDDIVLACNRIWKDTLSSDDMLYKCYTAAGIYQLAVEKKGGPAFEAAQREAAKKVTEFGPK